jgi:hypothetical protein
MSRPILHHFHSRSQAAGCRLCHNRSSEPLPVQGPFLSPGHNFRGVEMHGLAASRSLEPRLSNLLIRASEKLVRGTTRDCLCASMPP